MINRRYFLFIITVLNIQACANNKADLLNHNSDVKELDSRAFSHVSHCIPRTKNFFDDWSKYGGEVLESIQEMRKHIVTDNKSEFAKLVKSAWHAQEQQGFYEKKSELGRWPVINSRQSIVFESFLFSDENKLGECKALAMWNEFMYKYFSLNERGEMTPKLLEYPSTVEWIYPDNMLWLKYWVFVNVK